MSRAVRSLLAGAVVVLAFGGVLWLSRSVPTPEAAAGLLRAEGDRQWYRGNIHTHSLWSDGDDYLEMIALWYRDHEYDFLCFTDHNVLATTERWSNVEKNKGGRKAYEKLKARFPDWIDERQQDGRLEVRLRTFPEVAEKIGMPGQFLLIQGEEVTNSFGRLPVHMNATNVQDLIPPPKAESITEMIQTTTDLVISQRERTGEPMLVHLNHPNYGYGITAEDLMPVRGENFFEVYNGHPGVNNAGDEQRASTERIWDIILTKRIAELGLPLMYGLANDDGHNYHNIPSRASEPGRGWVMVLADELSPAALIAAMERGEFYASSGVSLREMKATAKGLSVAVKSDPGVTYTIDFIGTRKDYDPTSQPVLDKSGKPLRTTQRYSDDIGQTFQTVEGPEAIYEFTPDDLYVRARIISSRKHPNPSRVGEYERAWTQPHYGPAAPPIQ